MNALGLGMLNSGFDAELESNPLPGKGIQIKTEPPGSVLLPSGGFKREGTARDLDNSGGCWGEEKEKDSYSSRHAGPTHPACQHPLKQPRLWVQGLPERSLESQAHSAWPLSQPLASFRKESVE